MNKKGFFGMMEDIGDWIFSSIFMLIVIIFIIYILYSKGLIMFWWQY